MRRKSLDKNVVNILVFSLLTTLTWVGFEVYRAYTKIDLPDVSSYLTELNPTLDAKVLDKVNARTP